jgi:formylglycine-generating enzyme required for sulfatase activity
MASSGEKRRKRDRRPEPPVKLDEVVQKGGRLVWPADGAEMVLVPGGDFFMGRREGDIFAPEDERPGRKVRLSPFLIDREPVTNARFARFVDAGGYVDPHTWSPAGWAWRVRAGIDKPLSFTVAGFEAPEQPAAGVSWWEADAYCRWAGKELPTEAQWEKAARGADGRLFPWGDDLPRSAYLNFNGNVGRTTPVGAYPLGVSPYGLVDMSGNVNNWCRDWYWSGFYGWCARNGVQRDPCLDDDVRSKVELPLGMRSDRGGGFATSFAAFEVLAASGRLAWPPARRNLWNGFRCVVEL